MKYLAWSLVGLLAACTGSSPSVRGPEAVAPREVSGVLNGETVWSGEVLLVGDVLVPAGSRLTVAPGTTVRVRHSESTKIPPEYLSPGTELLVRGTLEVRGTEKEPVRFLPLEELAGEDPAWAGIELDRAAKGVIEGAVIRRAETGVLCIGASPLIRGNRLENCRYGIIVQQGAAPRILANVIAQGEGGIFCWREVRPLLQGNRILDHEEEGIFVGRASRPQLGFNRISGNAIGLALYTHDLSFDRSGISGNREDIRFLDGEGR